MNRFFIAAATGFLAAATVMADPPVAPAPAPAAAPAAAVPTTAPTLSSVPVPMVDNTLITPQRRMGLFSRIRSKNTAPMLTSTPAFTNVPTMAVPAGTGAPAGAGVPAPMPTTTPATPKPMPNGASSATPGVTGAPAVVGAQSQSVQVGVEPMTTGK